MTLRITFVGLVLAVLLGSAALYLTRAPETGVLAEDVRLIATDSTPGYALAFMTLRNTGSEPDILLGAVSELAGSCGFHGPTVGANAEGLPYVAIPAGSHTLLSPETAHIEMLGLEEELAPGDLVPITLVFQNAGELLVQARVEATVPPSEMTRQAGLYELPADEDIPVVEIEYEELEDRHWRITLTTENFSFNEDAVDKGHVPGEGHGHLYIDNEKIGRIFEPVFEIGPLEPGMRAVSVALNTNDHRAFAVDGEPIIASTEIYQCMCGSWGDTPPPID